MHILGWRASRSGARMTVTGYPAAGGDLVKVPVISIQGPSPVRVVYPDRTIGIRPGGEIVVLG